MRCEAARFALVVWPNNDIGCIPIADVDDAETRGAFPFAVEWDVVDAGMPVIEPLHSNPRRCDGPPDYGEQ